MPAPPTRSDRPRPFLKWAGGKTQLLAQFEALYPPAMDVRRYLEPFVGSGAVFFQVRDLLRPKEVILADSNQDLVQVYRSVRDEVEEVIRRLRHHRSRHSREHYYRVRALGPRRLSSAGRAARLIYLNKTCFNGLFRVNRAGKFNVPMGRYRNPPILDEENLRAASASLQKVELKVAHFRKTLDYARAGDFIYFDPPYHPVSATSYFTSYTSGSFQLSDQAELADVYRELHRRGCLLMLSNSECTAIRRLYERSPEFSVVPVSARRSINSNAGKRGRVSELAVLNYRPARGRTIQPASVARGSTRGRRSSRRPSLSI